VPQFCSVLVIAGPRSGLQPDELQRLDAYISTGGRLALLIDPPVDAGIAEWLKRYGIQAGQGIVIETGRAGRAVGAGPESPLALGYSSHPITRGFEIATIYDRAVPLDVIKTDVGKPAGIAATGNEAFERRGMTGPLDQFLEGRDRRGPLTLAVASHIPRGGPAAALPEPRLVVVGDSDFITNGWIGRQGNRDLAVRVIAWLAGEEEARIVSMADRQNRRISLTERARLYMYLVNLGLLPLVPLAAGLVQLLRSRRS
jgi:ABC-type uncharacterized transport system involved in gliding motility auxiliary subunit